MLREVKKGKISREEYVRKRKEYKAWCEEEKKYEAEEEKKIVVLERKWGRGSI